MAARGDVKVAVAELVKVAGIWEGVSGVVAETVGSAQSLALTPDQFSAIGDAAGLGAEYAKVQQMLVTFLQEGSATTHGVALALTASAATYDGTDSKNAGMFHGMKND